MDWVIIVDDDEENRIRTAEILSQEGMRVTELSSGNELLNYIEGMTPLPDLILLDILMPGLNGLDTLKSLRKKEGGIASLPVIFLSGNDDLHMEAEGLRLGAVDFIRKPYFPEILTLRVRSAIELERLHRSLSKDLKQKTRENTSLTFHVVQTLADAIDAKDTYTNGHSGRVAIYSKEIARHMGLTEQEQDEIYMMGLLHDVGKIGVPDWIINKPDRLTDEEFEQIKKHPEVGSRILKNIREMPKLSHGARWHHERFDGRGYPDGLKGAAIPEEARIIAVADAYDAMTSNRSYRKLLPQSVVRAELEKGKGSQFDPEIADIMIRIIDEDTEYTLHEGTAEKNGLPKHFEEEASRHMDEETSLPAALAELSELDIELGLFLCGDVEDYLDGLSIFAGSIPSKSEKLQNAFSSGDWTAYTTLVHSLKSSARTVGASGISDLAKHLEHAGKSADIDTILQDTPGLLIRYKSLEQPLKSILHL